MFRVGMSSGFLHCTVYVEYDMFIMFYLLVK